MFENHARFSASFIGVPLRTKTVPDTNAIVQAETKYKNFSQGATPPFFTNL